MPQPPTNDFLYDEPLSATPCENGFVIEGPHGVNVAMTDAALRETVRRFSAALDPAGSGLPLRELD